MTCCDAFAIRHLDHVAEIRAEHARELRKVAEAVREAALLKMLELSRNGIPCKPAWNNIYGERAATVTDYMEAIRTMPVDPIIESVKGE